MTFIIIKKLSDIAGLDIEPETKYTYTYNNVKNLSTTKKDEERQMNCKHDVRQKRDYRLDY